MCLFVMRIICVECAAFNFSFRCVQLNCMFVKVLLNMVTQTGIIMGMGSANERRHYCVTPSLIGRAHTQNDP